MAGNRCNLLTENKLPQTNNYGGGLQVITVFADQNLPLEVLI